MRGLGKTRFLFLVGLASLATACASVDFDYPKAESTAPDPATTADTYFGKEFVPDVVGKPEGQSGFYPVADAIDSLAIRLLMANEAEQTIDAQYYLLTGDVVGLAFLEGLLRAADRGVRVRLLLDDILTKGYDAGMAALDSHPNFEVRIFNPFANRSMRALDGITSFSRVNRRMHNKSFTVDSQITMVGGRNIAAEYFGGREDSSFGDLDVVGIGPVVMDVSNMFDSYWNHAAAAPVPSFADMPDDPAAALEQLRERLKQSRAEIIDSPYAEAVRRSADHFIKTDETLFTWAPYTVAYDSPDKSDKKKAEEAASITKPISESLSAAKEEIIIVSPYFVPLKSGVARIKEIIDSGIEVIIITNSYGANNHKQVHGGYAPYRKRLLEAGARLYEVRPDTEVLGDDVMRTKDTNSTLHTKAFLVDRRDLFIGSFNFDPRSANINTELGVIIESEKLGEYMGGRVDQTLPGNAYEVFLNEDGKIRWRAMDGGVETIFDKEPDTSWWNRFTLGFYRILPIRGQL